MVYNEWMDRWTMDRQMDEWMNWRSIDKLINIYSVSHISFIKVYSSTKGQ